jgi:sugar phosphate isomerase/epimerase
VLADPKPPILSITGAALDGDYADSWQRLRTTYRRHATLAGDLGLEVAFEPLGPTFMNTDTTVCTWRGALDLAQDVDHDSFRLAFDTWHVWDEPDIWSQLRDSIDRVASVHVSDFPAHGPRAFGDRLVPGDGVVSFPDLGRELRRAEYAGPVVLEIFSDERLPDSLWLQPAQEVVGRSWTYLHEVLGAALVS